MIEWSEQHQVIQDMVRKFIAAEIEPQLEELEHGDLPPYEVMRKLARTFGLSEAARMRYESEKRRAQEHATARAPGEDAAKKTREPSAAGDAIAMQIIPIIELSKYCPGMVTAMGVSAGLTAGAIMSRGTWAQKD